MTKRQETEFRERKLLQNNGWQVNKSSRYNSGGGTVRHAIAKMLAGHYLTYEYDYRVAFEVECSDGELDILAWGSEKRTSPIGVECETGLTDEIQMQKIDQYYHDEPLKDVFFIEVNDMPAEILPAYEWIAGKL